MAETPGTRLTRFTLHERHMAEILFGALALLVIVVAVGGYLYLSGPTSSTTAQPSP